MTLQRAAYKWVSLSITILVGCASASGVRPIGPDTYMASRQAATGFSGLGSLKADVLEDARKYCVEQKKQVQVVSTTESQPPYVLGNYPRAEVQFMCLSPGDSELSRPKLQPRPDVVVENRRSTDPVNRAVAELVPVSIESAPDGADVYVDSVFVGSTPLPNFGMRSGRHLLEISKGGFKKWSRQLSLQPGVPTHVKATLESPRH